MADEQPEDRYTTNSKLVTRIDTLLGKRDLTQREFADWFGGTADGGPNNDGLYPLTDSTGYTRMVPCPARQMQDVANLGGLTQEGVAALPKGTQNEVTSSVEVLATGSAGSAPKRYSPYMFASRRTKDLSVMPDSEYAEWISCLSSSGLERKIAVDYLQRSVGNVIDPTHPPYNVVYDYQKARKIHCTNGQRIIECEDPVFSQYDVGKTACISNGGSYGVLEGYISEVVDSKRIKLIRTNGSGDPLPAEQDQSAAEMIWGTDCTAGLQRAFDDAEPTGSDTLGKVVVLGGIAMARQLRFGSIGVVGLGTTTTGFVVLPKWQESQPFFADKNDGPYGSGRYKPHFYTLMNFSIFGQKYTQYYNSFRNNWEIRGGGFEAFLRGAPYARIDGIDTWEAQWNGANLQNAFAGLMNNVRAYFNAYCGLRVGLWDLNGQNWHVEGNQGAGVFSFLPGANITTVRAAYNGSSGGVLSQGGKTWPHELGANWTEAGYGNTVTNLRLQESWGHNLCFTGTDPLDTYNNKGNKNAFFLGTFDDTGNQVPAHSVSSRNLPDVRAMVYMKGNTCVNNTVDLVTGSGQVSNRNYATNAYWDSGDVSGNRVTINTPGITNTPSDWYDGNNAKSPGPWGTDSYDSIGTRNNIVKINDKLAP